MLTSIGIEMLQFFLATGVSDIDDVFFLILVAQLLAMEFINFFSKTMNALVNDTGIQ